MFGFRVARIGFTGGGVDTGSTGFSIGDGTTGGSIGRSDGVRLTTDWGGSTVVNSNTLVGGTGGIAETTASTTGISLLGKTTNTLGNITSAGNSTQIGDVITLVQIERITISNKGIQVGLNGNGFERNSNHKELAKAVGINWKRGDVVSDELRVVDG